MFFCLQNTSQYRAQLRSRTSCTLPQLCLSCSHFVTANELPTNTSQYRAQLRSRTSCTLPQLCLSCSHFVTANLPTKYFAIRHSCLVTHYLCAPSRSFVLLAFCDGKRVAYKHFSIPPQLAFSLGRRCHERAVQQTE